MLFPCYPQYYRHASALHRSKRLLAATTVLAGLASAPSVVLAQSPTSPDVDSLSQFALDKELELDRLTSQTHLQNNISTLRKRNRSNLWGFLNAGATEGGLIDATVLFFKHSKHLNVLVEEKLPDGGKTRVLKGKSNSISPGANAGQLYPQIIGQEVNFAGDSGELLYNILFEQRARQKALDPKSSLKRAKVIQEDLDAALEERDKLVSAMGNQKAAYEAEGAVLRDMRSSLLSEYERVYVSARKEYAWQNSFCIANLCRNAIGATGNQINVHASYIHNNGLNGTGALLSMIAAIGITTRPWVGLAASHWDGRRAQRTVDATLPAIGGESASSRATVQADAEKLKQLAKENDGMQARAATLDVQAKLLDKQEDLKQLEVSSTNASRMENLVRFTGYGPTKFANSLIAVDADYGNYKDRTITNRWQSAGSLTYTCGQGLNILEIIRDRVHDNNRTHRLHAEGRTTSQNLNSRIKELDDLMERNKKSSGAPGSERIDSEKN